jgi:hypothetical protein
MQGNVIAGADSLLTVKEAAARLAYLRISTHAFKIAGGDLRRFVRRCGGQC